MTISIHLNSYCTYRTPKISDPQGKVAIFEDILKGLNLTKKDALMVEDSYFYNYDAPKEAGIDALFIKNEVSRMPDAVTTDIQNTQEIANLEYIIE